MLPKTSSSWGLRETTIQKAGQQNSTSEGVSKYLPSLSPLLLIESCQDASRAFTMSLIDLAVPKTQSEVSLNYLDL